MAVTFTRSDLDRLLQMLIDTESGVAPANPHLAFGFRELAGTNNSLVPGQSTFGSADQPFATVTKQYFQTVTVNVDGTAFDPDLTRTGDTLTTTYATTDPNALGAQAKGVNVVDPMPRIISNLISDISQNNPAAVAAAQAFAAQLGDGYTAFNTNPSGLILPGADGKFGTADDQWGAGKDGIPGNADDLLGPDGVVSADDLTPVDKGNLFIGNITPDAGLSAPFNNWMTFFGQFFDHGLDLISKGGNGYVYIPLQPGDPLYVEGGTKNFMVLERASDITILPGADGKLGTSDDIHQFRNQTSPFVDQNQTYASDGSHNAFLREYMIGADGKLHSTGKMLEHTTSGGAQAFFGDDPTTAGIDESLDDVSSGMATWADLKTNALRFGLRLTDFDVKDVPLLATDAYGNLILDATGHVQIMVNTVGGPIQFALDPTNARTIAQIEAAAGGTVMHTGHAFINDMARAANPYDDAGNPKVVFDGALLNQHYVAGDGRVNENIALTTVHEIFHSEHNRLIDQVKATVQAQLDAGDTAFATAWVIPGTVLTPGTAISDNAWNGERLMQVAKFGTETQYQHLVFEEFARKVAPTIHLFGNVDIHLDPAITSEFANAIYRFGHSMLDENVPLYQVDANGQMVIGLDGKPVLTNMGLIQAFTNPLAFANLGATGAAQIVQGTTHQIGSEIDEFVTGALRNNLLGLPLDLAALNIARGRDTGVAPLNLVRAQIYDATHDQTLKPYANWLEFGQFLKHPESLVNFIAAYGTHTNITSLLPGDLAGKRAAALHLMELGLDPASKTGDAEHVDAYNFIHSLGAYANDVNSVVAVHAQWSTGNVTGVDNIDLWVGGLAEKQNLFGGLLGSTFNFIFETQLENLQDGDRLYYLPRIEGLDFGQQIENNSFADMIIANTGAKHIPASIFLTPEYTVEAATVTDDPATWLKNPVTGAYLVEKLADGTVHFIGDDNFFGNTMVLGGTAGDDRLQAGHADDDTVWGDAGNDWIDGGNGNDFLYGGTGDDTFVDSAGDDVIHGEQGNDTVFAGIGDDVVFGNDGNDYVDGGAGIDDIVGGAGNDVLKGGEDDDEILGNEGDDWIEGGAGGDNLTGDTGAPTGMVPLFAGNDVIDGGANGDKMVGFSGDDIMLGEGGFDKFYGKLGFDWASWEKETHGVSVDMERREFIANPIAPAGDAIRDFFIETEAASGTKFDDFIQGTEDAGRAAGTFNELQNLDLIFNLNTFFQGGVADDWNAAGAVTNNGTGFDNGNILLGGDGSDTIMGRGGNDIIDGDAFLHVYLTGNGGAGSEIVREIQWDTTDGDIDTAVFRDVIANYTISAPDANGFITVAHNGVVAGVINGVRVPTSDGADKVRNVERLQFADVTINIDPNPNANLPPTGTLLITDDDANAATPVNAVVGTALTVDLLNSNVADPDGIVPGSVHYQWQYSNFAAPGGTSAWVDIVGATGTSFTPTNNLIRSPIRVVEIYTDAKGLVEKVVSAETLGVIANPAPVINTAPFVINQQGLTGLPDTAARVGFPINILLPLTQTFGDNETAANNLIFTATLADGTPLPANLIFTLIPDAVNGGFSGATITGSVNTPGPIGIKITATDTGPGTPLTVTDTFVINVQTGNLSPVVNVAQSANGLEDTIINGQLLGPLVPDPDGPAATPVWRIVQGSAVNGTVAVNGNTGAFVFRPAAGLSSSDAGVPPTFSFQYRLFDGLSYSAPQTVTINVAPVDDGSANISITGTAAVNAVLTAVIGLDPDGAWLAGSDHYQWVRDAGTVNETFIGTDSANYTVTADDVGHQISVSATYTDAQGANDATVPAATLPAPVGLLSVVGVNGAVPTLNVSNTLVDPDGGPFAGSIFYTWEVSADGINFLPADPLAVSLDGTSFAPAPTGVAGAYVRLTTNYIDGLGNLDTAVSEVIHYVVADNTVNVITGIGEDDIIFSLGGDDVITAGACKDFVDAGDGNDRIIATAGDDNDIYYGGAGIDTLVLTGNQGDYAIVKNGDGSIDITDHRAFAVGNGADHLTSIELLQFANGSIIPTVDPTLQADTYSTNEDVALSVVDPALGVLGNDTFVLPLNASIATNPTHGTLTLNPNGTFTYTPSAGFAGTDTFTYTAANGSSTGGPETVTITITAVNDGASAVSITGNATQGQTLTAVVGPDPDGAGTVPTFQWLRDGAVIGGATNGTYNVAAADVGARISVRVSYTDGQGFVESPTSAQTGVVTGGAATINGTNGADTLVGTAAGETINGLNGNDIITANGGNDIVNGGAGNDTFFASIGDGNDTYDGGAGIDTYNMGNTLAASNVNLALGTANSIQTGNDILISIENVTGSAGDNIIVGDANANRLLGNGGNDTLDGGSAGADNLRGGTGDDTYIVSHNGMTLVENAGQGTDTVQSSITFQLGANFENLTLTGSGNINGTGNGGANVLIGNSGNNVLTGGSGNDTFIATMGDGNDTYQGGAGQDTLDLSRTSAGATVNLAIGSASSGDIGTDILSSIERVIGSSGNDVFIGGNPPEVFTGGFGNDTFTFLTRQAVGNAATRSTVTDFAVGADHIDFSAIDADTRGGAGSGLQHFTFAGQVAAGAVGLQQVGFHYEFDGNGVEHTIIEGNVRTANIDPNAVDFQLDLIGHINLTGTDFIL